MYKGPIYGRKRARSSYDHWPRWGTRRKSSERDRLVVQQIYKELGELSQPLTVILCTSTLLATQLASTDPLSQDLNLIAKQITRVNTIIKNIHELIHP